MPLNFNALMTRQSVTPVINICAAIPRNDYDYSLIIWKMNLLHIHVEVYIFRVLITWVVYFSRRVTWNWTENIFVVRGFHYDVIVVYLPWILKINTPEGNSIISSRRRETSTPKRGESSIVGPVWRLRLIKNELNALLWWKRTCSRWNLLDSMPATIICNAFA